MSGDLRQAVEEWLKESSFPMEMQVARALDAAGLGVAHAAHYTDPNSGAVREIDVRGFAIQGGVAVGVTIECKHDLRPWVAFGSPHCKARPDFWMFTHPASREARDKLGLRWMSATGSVPPGFDSKNGLVFFQERIAYAVRPARLRRSGGDSKNANDDPKLDYAYEAVLQALSAAEAYVTTESHVPDAFVMPIVVLEGRLFWAESSPDGQTHAEEVGRVVLNWGRSVDKPGRRFIHVFTLPSFLSSVSAIANDVNRLAELLL